jgi:hypothetical protein
LQYPHHARLSPDSTLSSERGEPRAGTGASSSDAPVGPSAAQIFLQSFPDLVRMDFLVARDESPRSQENFFRARETKK